MKRYSCNQCTMTFIQQCNVLNHVRNVHTQVNCQQCGKIFFGESALKKHVKIHNVSKLHNCAMCSKQFACIYNLLLHIKLCRSEENSGAGIGGRNKAGIERRNESESDAPTKRSKVGRIMRVRLAFKGAAATYRLSLNKNDEIDGLKDSIFLMERKISKYQVCRQALKLTMAIHAVLVKANDSSIETNPAVVLNTQPFEVYAVMDIPTCLLSAYEQLISDIKLFQRNESGWVLAHINWLDLTLWELDPLRGSSYHEFPMLIKDK